MCDSLQLKKHFICTIGLGLFLFFFLYSFIGLHLLYNNYEIIFGLILCKSDTTRIGGAVAISQNSRTISALDLKIVIRVCTHTTTCIYIHMAVTIVYPYSTNCLTPTIGTLMKIVGLGLGTTSRSLVPRRSLVPTRRKRASVWGRD